VVAAGNCAKLVTDWLWDFVLTGWTWLNFFCACGHVLGLLGTGFVCVLMWSVWAVAGWGTDWGLGLTVVTLVELE